MTDQGKVSFRFNSLDANLNSQTRYKESSFRFRESKVATKESIRCDLRLTLYLQNERKTSICEISTFNITKCRIRGGQIGVPSFWSESLDFVYPTDF